MSRIVLMIFFALFCGLVFTGCNKNEATNDADYLIFGHFYGMCRGEGCIEIFKLEKEKLFEDTNDNYPSWNDFYVGNFVQLSQEQFDKTKDLINYFPIELLSDRNIVFGLPDASDGGGLYIEYNYGGIRKYWILDNMKRDVPPQYHEFMDKVNEKIMLLQ